MPRKQPSTSDTAPVLSIRDVVAIYGVKLGTLKSWRHRNKGPRSFLRGGRVVYRQEDVEAWFEAEETESSRGQVVPPASRSCALSRRS